MTGVAEPPAERYAAAHTTPPTAELEALQKDTIAQLASPQMLSGPVEGRLLELLVHAVQARLVLELGTFSGFSALSMAAGLPPGGRIVTCEVSPEHAEFALRRIQASPHANRIELRVGPALETIATLPGPFDLVFIDADKTGYPAYYEAVLPKLSDHGLIVVDNTLWSGRVIEPAGEGEDARALAAFNDALLTDDRVVCVMLTVRDGVTLIRRR
ncbi:MAG: class I SAM-dependent methyltransferase [Actinobacteria bacterium]|nr:class I SAM-dependent methyltransferase [Actinomycetota bacterium]